MKKQIKVLKEIFQVGKEITPKEISKATGLTKREVYSALRSLYRRMLIKKRRVMGKKDSQEEIGYKSPPNNTILVRINDDSIRRARELTEKEE